MMNSADEIDSNIDQHNSSYSDLVYEEQAPLLSQAPDQIQFSHRLGGIDHRDDPLDYRSSDGVRTLRSRRRGLPQSASRVGE